MRVNHAYPVNCRRVLGTCLALFYLLLPLSAQSGPAGFQYKAKVTATSSTTMTVEVDEEVFQDITTTVEKHNTQQAVVGANRRRGF